MNARGANSLLRLVFSLLKLERTAGKKNTALEHMRYHDVSYEISAACTHVCLEDKQRKKICIHMLDCRSMVQKITKHKQNSAKGSVITCLSVTECPVMCRWECLPDLCHCAGRQHLPVVQAHGSPQPARTLAAAYVPLLLCRKEFKNEWRCTWSFRF